MRVKVLTRNPDDYLRETTRDIHKVPRNYDPKLHPLEAPREYTRALNAVKLDRVFAKPFIGSLDGHTEGISVLCKRPKSLSTLASGAFDGEVRLWDLPTRRCLKHLQAHENFVRGIAFTKDGERFATVGDDKTIKFWNVSSPGVGEEERPLKTIVSKVILTGIAFSPKIEKFATCGEICQIWEETRNEPVRSFSWGKDSVDTLAFNPVEPHILGTSSQDRSITFYDIREAGPIKQLTLTMRTNQLAWNPMESTTYTVANEDFSLYTFDMRFMASAVTIHKGHTSAVTCLDYSPTGQEIVSGSYDRTLRIFQKDKKFSRDVYHTKRMQRITDVVWSSDNKYIINSSDEMNLRIWKAKASEKLGVLRPREKRALNYNEALVNKFELFPEIRSINRHRHVPKYIQSMTKKIKMNYNKERRKAANRRAHSKPGTEPEPRPKSDFIVSNME
uniref:DDB1- and CUL4-associated factor 13 n=1 Tax=Lygus hesperus TaxID=30085 RepID=A0A0A9WR51_LYGHE